MGGHAIAITGFSLGRSKLLPYGPTDFKLRATRVDKLYGHDDQVGPFARMELDGRTISQQVGNETRELKSISTSWVGSDGILGSVRAAPMYLIVPLYPKIRIRFEFIRSVMIDFDSFLKDLIRVTKSPIPSDIEWDIHLTTVNQLKSDLRSDGNLPSVAKRLVLLKNMPRFIWRVRAYFKDLPHLELLFDATDIEQGPFCICGIEYDKTLFRFLKGASRIITPMSQYQQRPYWRILEWFANKS